MFCTCGDDMGTLIHCLSEFPLEFLGGVTSYPSEVVVVDKFLYLRMICVQISNDDCIPFIRFYYGRPV